MTPESTDFTKTLEELTGLNAGSADEAPTPMVEDLIRSWKKPLQDLSDEEIGDLVVQHDGYPFVLDLLWPKLVRDPLFDGGLYPGAVLSMLIQAEAAVWVDRPHYNSQLENLYGRALERSPDEVEAFRESLNLPTTGAPTN